MAIRGPKPVEIDDAFGPCTVCGGLGKTNRSLRIIKRKSKVEIV